MNLYLDHNQVLRMSLNNALQHTQVREVHNLCISLDRLLDNLVHRMYFSFYYIQVLYINLDILKRHTLAQGLYSLDTLLDGLQGMPTFLYSFCYPNRHIHHNQLDHEP